jgi:hypothetical protein
MPEPLAVFVQVRKPDGSLERVRVGTAQQVPEGLLLTLGELLAAAAPAPADAPRPQPPPSGAIDVFPPYGRSKGLPIRGASAQDLEFYASGSRRSLADPAKARFHDRERVMLAAIEAEQARQQREGRAAAGPGPGAGSEEPPPHTDDDIPF